MKKTLSVVVPFTFVLASIAVFAGDGARTPTTQTAKENTMLSKLPAPVLNYLAAEKSKDAEKLAACFASEGWVHDEAKDYRGIDAIAKWKREADTKYQYTMEPLDASVSDKTVKLRARLTGNFPGSPVELNFTFTIADDKIKSLDIH
jgi:hypothetical protein